VFYQKCNEFNVHSYTALKWLFRLKPAPNTRWHNRLELLQSGPSPQWTTNWFWAYIEYSSPESCTLVLVQKQ